MASSQHLESFQNILREQNRSMSNPDSPRLFTQSTATASKKSEVWNIVGSQLPKIVSIVPGLESLMSSDEFDGGLKKDIELLLRIIWRPYHDMDAYRLESSRETLASQRTILERKIFDSVSLKQVFLPGLFAYSKRRILSETTPFEECLVIQSREPSIEDIQGNRRVFGIKCLSWVLDQSLGNLVLVPRIFPVNEYYLRRGITFDDLGLVPFEALPAGERETVRDRFIKRGKDFVETFRTPSVAVWDYQGPAWRPRSGDGETSGFDGWNSSADQINCRVFVRPEEPEDIRDRMPINDVIAAETFMTISTYVVVKTLPDLEKALVPFDGLKPVNWLDVSLGSYGAWLADVVPDMVRSFDKRCEEAGSDVERQEESLLFVLRGDETMDVSALGALADDFRRPFAYMDILDHLTEDGDPHDKIKEILDVAGDVSALNTPNDVLIQVLGEEFRRILERFRGIVFLCLEKDDEIDPSFERLGLVHITAEKDTPS
ncbi:hypothetical protein CPLU01_09966 [Colletotrichum plurivorum]|uniref:Uncharacterized protein n=1 Tax=Colletotrichum plurivorum TaxID=2175906 RepID=A0A8H6K6T0_9PEZI|nr:hypothetical protein CPLU01_09966 [Colletotrichum plurivorum]